MGRSKAELPFGNETMLQRVVRLLEGVVSPVVVVAAPRQVLPELPAGVQVVRDTIDHQGPLAGMLAGLSALQSEVPAAFVCGCDAPLLRADFVRRLIVLLDGHELVVPREGTRHHPLAGVYRTCLVERIASLIAADRLRPMFLVEESRAVVVDADALREVDPNLNSLRNTNTPAEYRDALRIAGYA